MDQRLRKFTEAHPLVSGMFVLWVAPLVFLIFTHVLAVGWHDCFGWP